MGFSLCREAQKEKIYVLEKAFQIQPWSSVTQESTIGEIITHSQDLLYERHRTKKCTHFTVFSLITSHINYL